jgi:hypothetical protein
VETECEITGIGSIDIPIVWNQVVPMLESALTRSDGEYFLQDIYALLMYHKMQLWVVADEVEIKTCIVTEFRHFPQKKICYIVLSAGEGLSQWAHLMQELEQWAYDEGADLIRAYGLKGWEAVVKPLGYSTQQLIYCKELHIPNGHAH